MPPEIERIAAALPATIDAKVRSILATILWVGCEFGSGNAVVGLFPQTKLSPVVLARAAELLGITNRPAGGYGWSGAMDLLSCHSTDPVIEAVLRSLDRAALAGTGTPHQFDEAHA